MSNVKNFNGGQMNQTATIIRNAGADIEDVRNRIMKYDENGKFVLATAGTDFPVGVAIIEAGYNDISGVESGKVKAGEDVTVQIKDIGFVLAGAEIKEGQEVTAGADGKAVVATSGNFVLGIALNSVAAGDYLEIQYIKYQKN